MRAKKRKKQGLFKNAVLMTTVVAMGLPTYAAATGVSESNLLLNASFDSNGWEAVNEAGIQKRGAKDGQSCFFINPGENNAIKQNVTIPESGTYTLSAWLITGNNENASFQVVDTRSGEVISTYTADGNETCQGYTECKIEDIALEKGQNIEIIFNGISNAWVNGDDISLYSNVIDEDILQNGGLEVPGWEFVNNAEVDNSNPHTGKYHFTLSAGTENMVKQSVEIAEEGDYTASAWLASAAENGKFSIVDSETGAVLANQTIGDDEDYTQYTLDSVHLNAGQKVDVVLSGGNGWIKGDDVSLSAGEGTVDPSHPTEEFTTKHDVLDFEETDEAIVRNERSEEPVVIDFDDMVNASLTYWGKYLYKSNATYSITDGGRNNSKCLCITSPVRNDVALIKTLKLEPNKPYILEGYIKGEDIDSEDVVGPNLCVYGTWSHVTQLNNTPGDFGWKHVAMMFEAPEDGEVKIACRLGFWSNTTSGTAYFDDVKVTGLNSMSSKYLNLELDDDLFNSISDERLRYWMHNLDNAYVAYADLVGTRPFDGDIIGIRESYERYGWAWAGHPIGWADSCIPDQLKSLENREDWSFGILHEIGHNYDVTYGDEKDCGWNFHGELFANFKMAYVLERLNGTVWQDRAYKGKEIEEYYRANAGNAYTKSVKGKSAANLTQKEKENVCNSFNDGVTYCLFRIKNKIGWEPFQLTFREFVSEGIQPGSRIAKFDKFLELLQKNYNEGGTEVYDTFEPGELEYIRDIFESVK